VTLTYLYLASAEEISHPMGDPEEVRAGIARSLSSIAAGEYEPAPGPACVHCDFRSFCDAGREWLADNA
jgi:hypothetical protein